MPSELSEATLRDCGYTARQEYGPDLHGLCREAGELVGNLLIDAGLPVSRDAYSVKRVRVGPCGEERHYIVTIPGQYVAGVSSTDSVYVDPTLTQFCAANAADGRVDVNLGSCDAIPDVVVAYPGDTARDYYKSPLNCRGQALTPETLTLAHKAELTGRLDHILNKGETEMYRTFQTSARTKLQLSVDASEGHTRPSPQLRLTAAKSALPTPLQGETPDRMDNHLRGLHDDIRDALSGVKPSNTTFMLEWEPTRVTRQDREYIGRIVPKAGIQ